MFGYAFAFALSGIVFVLWTMLNERQALYSSFIQGWKITILNKSLNRK